MSKVDKVKETFQAYRDKLTSLKVNDDSNQFKAQLIENLNAIEKQVLETRCAYYEYEVEDFNRRFEELKGELDKLINHIHSKAPESHDYVNKNREKLDVQSYTATYLQPILAFGKFITHKSDQLKADNRKVLEFSAIYLSLQIALPVGLLFAAGGFMLGGPIGVVVGATIGVGLGVAISAALIYRLHQVAERPSVTNAKMYQLLGHVNTFFNQPLNLPKVGTVAANESNQHKKS